MEYDQYQLVHIPVVSVPVFLETPWVVFRLDLELPKIEALSSFLKYRASHAESYSIVYGRTHPRSIY